jgi:starvation-inducible DNA-binding protein
MTTQTQAEPAQYREDPRGANRADVPVGLTELLADMFAVYLKTKNFHWHVSGPHFRDYHLLLDEQATQILGTMDTIAERVRKLGGQTIKSIGHISRLQQSRTTMPTRLRRARCWANCCKTVNASPKRC